MTDPDAAPPRPVRLVFDTSAITAFARGSIHVGEVLSEIADENSVALLPLGCVVEAVHGQQFTGEETARLDLLIDHDAAEVIAADPATWRLPAYTYDIVGRHDAASAAVTALEYGVDVLSRYPGLYAGIDGGSLVLPLDG